MRYQRLETEVRGNIALTVQNLIATIDTIASGSESLQKLEDGAEGKEEWKEI